MKLSNLLTAIGGVIILIFLQISCSSDEKSQEKTVETKSKQVTNQNITIKEVSKIYLGKSAIEYDFSKLDTIVIDDNFKVILEKKNGKTDLYAVEAHDLFYNSFSTDYGELFFAMQKKDNYLKIFDIEDNFKLKKVLPAGDFFAVGKKYFAIANENELNVYSLASYKDVKQVRFNNKIKKILFFQKADNLLVFTKDYNFHFLKENKNFSVLSEDLSQYYYYNPEIITGKNSEFIVTTSKKAYVFRFENDTIKNLGTVFSYFFIFKDFFIPNTDFLLFNDGIYKIKDDTLIKIKDFVPEFDLVSAVFSDDSKLIAFKSNHKIYLLKNTNGNFEIIGSIELGYLYTSSFYFGPDNKKLYIRFLIQDNLASPSSYDEIIAQEPYFIKVYEIQNNKIKELEQPGFDRIVFFQIVDNYILTKYANGIEKILDIDNKMKLIDTFIIKDKVITYLDNNFKNYLIKENSGQRSTIYKLDAEKNKKIIATISPEGDYCNALIRSIKIFPYSYIRVRWFFLSDPDFNFDIFENNNEPTPDTIFVIPEKNYDSLIINVYSTSKNKYVKNYILAKKIESFYQNKNLIYTCSGIGIEIYNVDDKELKLITSKKTPITKAKCNSKYIAVQDSDDKIKIFLFDNNKLTEKFDVRGKLIDLNKNNILEIKNNERTEFYYIGNNGLQKIENIKKGKRFLTQKYIAVLDAQDTLHFYEPIFISDK